MKLVPTSVILLLSALSAQAAVTVADGKVYDVGKGNYSADPGVENNADHLLCWAATAANVFQHWQDRYLTATAGIPNGIVPDAERLSYPGGTQYLEIYQAFLPNFKDKGGLFSYAVDWYFNGKSGSYLNAGAAKGGYLPGKVDSTYYAYWTEKQNNTFTNMAELKYALDQAFRSEGVAVYLGIITPSNSGHAITCWGYETDADGNLNALYVTDSDDRHYGARRVDLHVEENGKISLSSEYTGGSYSSGTYAFKDGDASGVSLTLANATIAKNGGMMWEDATLTLADVAFSGDVTFNLGYFADMNRLDLTGATFAAGSTVSFILDLGSEAGKQVPGPLMSFGYPWQDMEEEDLTRVYVNMGDYFTGDTSALDGVNLALTVTGTIADDALLIIDTDGFGLDRRDVDVPDCIYRRTEDGRLYYGAPEPATTTLSLLALAALCARRRSRRV